MSCSGQGRRFAMEPRRTSRARVSSSPYESGRPQKAECAEAAEQADAADEVHEGRAARPSPLISVFARPILTERGSTLMARDSRMGQP
jgi:hypothetical protein